MKRFWLSVFQITVFLVAFILLLFLSDIISDGIIVNSGIAYCTVSTVSIFLVYAICFAVLFLFVKVTDKPITMGAFATILIIVASFTASTFFAYQLWTLAAVISQIFVVFLAILFVFMVFFRLVNYED